MSDDIRYVAGNIIVIIIVLYVAFMITDTFCKQTPDYCTYGWAVYGALIVGAIIYFKYAVFS